MKYTFQPALAAGLLLLVSPVQAEQNKAYLYSAPNANARVIARTDADTTFDIHGCLEDGSWCDVSYNRTRGWIPGEFVKLQIQQGRSYAIEKGPYTPGPAQPEDKE